MQIILDSNIFISDYLMSGPHFSLFFELVKKLGHKIILLEIVEDELINKYSEKLKDFIDSHNKFKNNLVGCTDNKTFDFLLLKEKYREHLNNMKMEHNILSIAYPKISHKAVVQYMFDKKSPIKDGEKGYRDLLIWESVILQVKKTNETIVFISENSTDFGQNNKLFPELVAQIKIRDKLLYFNSLKYFNENYLLNYLEVSNDFKVDVNYIKEWFVQNLTSIESNHSLFSSVYTDNMYCEYEMPINVLIVKFIQEYIKQITNDEYYLKFEVSFKFELYISKIHDQQEFSLHYEDDYPEEDYEHSIAYVRKQDNLAFKSQFYLSGFLKLDKNKKITAYEILEFGDKKLKRKFYYQEL